MADYKVVVVRRNGWWDEEKEGTFVEISNGSSLLSARRNFEAPW